MRAVISAISLLLCLLPFAVAAQAIDNTLSYKNINQDSYLRINYENDAFSGTDRAYTQGADLELVSPRIKKFPLSKILVHPHYGYIRYGLGIESDAYTPKGIAETGIQYGDYPFAATLFLKTFLTAIDTAKGRRFSTTLSTGVIGAAAGGMDMQTAIHRALSDSIPHGWPNQIRNDAVLNYQVDFEQKLLSAGHFFMLDGNVTGRVGTLSDKACLGITLMAGYFDAPYSRAIATGKNFRIYAYDHPEIDIVGYDATLEGGVFNRSSPYTISPKDMETFVFQNRYGVVIVYRKVYIEYFQSVMSSEFRGEDFHVWGGLQVAFAL